MKKFTFLFLMTAMTSSFIFAQATIWSEDFASGIPGTWANSGTDKNNITHAGMWKYTHTGNAGSFSTASTLYSPSAANGFIIFDSDLLDNGGGPSGAQGAGIAPSPQRGYLQTAAFSCTGHSHVYLEFYQNFLNYSAKPRIIVSNGTISDTIEVNTTLDYEFARTTNPSLQHFDISHAAANQAAVTLTFLWDKGDYYYWMLDDIKVMDAPANDLAITRAGSYDYTVYPLSQVDSIGYYARVQNTGTVSQPNSKVGIIVKQGTSVVFTDASSAGITIPYGVDSPLIGTNAWLPNQVTGRYDCYINTFSDSVDAYKYNNNDTSHFYINDSIYAIDNGIYGGAFQSYFNGTYTENANVFQVKKADTVTSITTSFLHTAGTTGNPSITPVGTVVQCKIYSVDATNPNNYLINNNAALISTEQRTLTASDFAPGQSGPTTIKNIYLRIDPKTGASGAAILQPGFYAASVAVVSTGGTVLLHSAQSKVFGQRSGSVDVNSTASPFTFYRNTNFYIRMNFGHGFNLLTCSFTRFPSTATIKGHQRVQYRGNSNSTSGAAVYAWDFGNGDTAIGQNPYYTYPDTGTYTICLTVYDGASSVTTCNSVTVRGFTGINEISEFGNVAMMPNPTTGKVTITAEDVTGTVKIQLYNILGAEMKSYTEEANGTLNKTYNFSDLSSGNYIVRLINGDKMTTRRLTISKQ